MSQTVFKYALFLFTFLIFLLTSFVGMNWFSDRVVLEAIAQKNIQTGSLVTDVNGDQVKSPVAPVVKDISLPIEPVVEIYSQSALSVEFGDSDPKFLLKKDEGKVLPIASLTKLMTALVVLENYNLSEKITVSQLAMNQDGEQGELKLGQVFSVKGLLYVMLMESSNRASFSLAERVGKDNFIKLMNERTLSLGLNNTHFQDVTGLLSSSYSTASDLAFLSSYLFKNYPLFREITSKKEHNLFLPNGSFHHRLISTNKLLGQNNIVGGKTGFTDAAGGCFMTIQQGQTENKYTVNIVLGADDRFFEMQKIIDNQGNN